MTIQNTNQENNLSFLESTINYQFTRKDLLIRALTRYAYAEEQNLDTDAHMDAFATLGDAVIDLLVIESVIRSGETQKGVITTRKMDLVNMSALRDIGKAIDLEKYVFWGKGEVIQHVWTSGRVLAECMEAILGAIYLDSDIKTCRFVLSHLGLIQELSYQSKPV